MSNEKGSVVFRRIGGRIVPIKVKDAGAQNSYKARAKEVAVGSTLLGVGAAVAGAGGHAHRQATAGSFKLYKRGLAEAVDALRTARGVIPKLPRRGEQLQFSFRRGGKAGLNTLTKAKALLLSGPRISKIAGVAGLALAIPGAAKVYSGISDDKDPGRVAAAAALGGGSVVSTAIAIGLGAKGGYLKILADTLRRRARKAF